QIYNTCRGSVLKNLTSLKRALETLRSAQDVTIVGANERGGTTRLILDSLRNPACAFPGRINLVNRRGEAVYGLPSVTSVSEIDGDPGIAWMIVGGQHLLP